MSNKEILSNDRLLSHLLSMCLDENLGDVCGSILLILKELEFDIGSDSWKVDDLTDLANRLEKKGIKYLHQVPLITRPI